jgi:hypothetical protein
MFNVTEKLADTDPCAVTRATDALQGTAVAAMALSGNSVTRRSAIAASAKAERERPATHSASSVTAVGAVGEAVHCTTSVDVLGGAAGASCTQ